MISKLLKLTKSYLILTIGIVTLIFFLFSFFIAKKDIIFADGAGYFSYPFELFKSGSLLYEGENSSTIFGVRSQDGRNINKYPIGTGIFLTPAFILGEIFNNRAKPLIYDPSYQFFTGIIGIVILCLGLLVLNKILLRFFSNNISVATLYIIAFSTNLFVYGSVDSSFSHVYSFLSINLFILFLIKWHEVPSKLNSVLLGISLGLIILLRQSNITILLLFLFYDINISSLKTSLVNKVIYYKKNFKNITLIIGVTLLICVPQIIYWITSTNNLFYFSYTMESFNLLNPQIWNVLFNKDRGAVLYHPIYLYIVSGVYVLNKFIPKLFISVIIFIAVNFYVISSWWYSDYGIGFGHRAFVDFMGIFALLIAATLSALNSYPKLKRLSYFIIVILTLLNALQTIRYIYL